MYSHQIRCPFCNNVSPWTPQSVDVTVQCPHRECVSYFAPDKYGKIRPDLATMMYYTTAGEFVMLDSYVRDLYDEIPTGSGNWFSRDRDPKWVCGGVYIVTAVKGLNEH